MQRVLVVLWLVIGCIAAQHVERGHGGAVATVNPLATEAALDVLKAGGNAIDAAVAAAAVINVTDPFSAGIGGGGFMVIYLADEGRVITIDAREMAPAAARADMFIDPETGSPISFNPERISSGLAVGVPGTLAGWDEALRRYGTMGLAELLEPAIRIAEEGFEVTELFNRYVTLNRDRFAAFTSTAAVYLTPEGEPPPIGSVHTNPDMAATLRLIAEQGINVFYRGEIARDIVETVNNPPTVAEPPFTVRPQNMTLEDLDTYTAIVRPALGVNYRGFDIIGMGPPSSAALTIGLALNILSGYDLATLPRDEALHLMLEAMRLAYADRGRYMADSDFVRVPVAGLLNPAFAAERRALIADVAAEPYPPGNPFRFQDNPVEPLEPEAWLPNAESPNTSTTHLTVADAMGNVVSYTFTIETIGGSGIVVPGRGFLLNNELTDFNAMPGGANTVEPRKRPRSSMAPTIVLQNGRPLFALGSPGGATIITTVLQTIINVLDFGMPLEEALQAPRIYNLGGANSTVEEAFDATLVAALEERGHSFNRVAEVGAATGIAFAEDGTMIAVAEAVRRGGGSARVVEPLD